ASRYNGPGNSTDAAYQIIVDISGNVYVTGTSSGSGTGNDYATIKYNSAGVQQWVQRYNGPGNSTDEAYRIAVSDSGNVYVTGYSRSGSSAGTEDCTTIKYNSAGVQQWVQRFNNGANEIGLSIAVDVSGNVYVAGFVWNGSSSIDYLTLKYNSSGVQQWVNIHVQVGTGVAFSLAVDGSGNVYVTGYSLDEVSGNDGYLTIKYNSSGSFQWGTKYNGTGNGADTAYSLAVDGSGNVYVTGSSSGLGSGTDYATIKYNSSGVQQWVQRYNGPGNGRDAAYSLAVDGSGNVHVTGLSAGSGTGDDFATIKYSQTGSLLTLNLTSFIEGFYNPVSNNMISDSVRVFLKNISSPYNTIDSSKGKLSSSGTGAFLFSNAVNGTNYYLVIKHRNTIETWSSAGVAFSAGILSYDFTNALNKAYGNNMKLSDASPVRFAFYSGDVNQDGTIDASDLSETDNASFNSLSGYVRTDVTGDDFVDAADVSIVDNNAFNSVSVVRP
ncbi:MAG: SBBP repeat-containing protein, partial [Nitrosomonas sp.]